MLPELPGPYDVVLGEIMEELRQKPVKAILLAGSAATGKLRPPVSDLDVLIVDDSTWTIRHESRREIEVHWSIGSEAAWRAVWQRDLASDLGANISLMAGSTPVHDPHGVGEQLIREAQTLYAGGPKLSPQWIESRRRWLTELANDLLEAPAENQPYICSLLVFMAVPCAFALTGHWQPRHKEAMTLLSQANPGLFTALNHALRGHNIQAYTDLRNEVGLLLEPFGGWWRHDS